MALGHQDATTGGCGNPPRGTLTGYFVRYRLALYRSSRAVVDSGVALNGNWLTAAGSDPILAFLPCILIMFICMRHGTRRLDKTTRLPDKTLPVSALNIARPATITAAAS